MFTSAGGRGNLPAAKEAGGSGNDVEGMLMAQYSKEEVLQLLGGPIDLITENLHDFTRSAEVLSSDHPRLIDQHPMQWVGIYKGRVVSTADDMESLRAKLRELKIPIHHAIIRFIDGEEKTVLL